MIEKGTRVKVIRTYPEDEEYYSVGAEGTVVSLIGEDDSLARIAFDKGEYNKSTSGTWVVYCKDLEEV